MKEEQTQAELEAFRLDVACAAVDQGYTLNATEIVGDCIVVWDQTIIIGDSCNYRVRVLKIGDDIASEIVGVIGKYSHNANEARIAFWATVNAIKAVQS